jgi:4-hydroxybenzoate polyprenyltransferase
MPRIDGIKEELAWLKVVFGVLAAIDASLAAWVAQNVGGSNRVLVCGAFVAITVVTAGVVSISRLVYRQPRELEHL